MLEQRTLTARIIGLAIEVHRTVGPGLLESVYAECVAVELAHAGIGFDSQVTVPVIYEDITNPLGFRADIIVENTIILEIKSVATVLPTRESQLFNLPPHEPSSYWPADELPFPAPQRRSPTIHCLTGPHRLRGTLWSSCVLRDENRQPRRPHNCGSDPTTAIQRPKRHGETRDAGQSSGWRRALLCLGSGSTVERNPLDATFVRYPKDKK